MVGGFPKDIPLGEDMYVCAKMLMAGFKIQYCAEALVFHSHNLSMVEEFKRYYATGFFHAKEKWLIESFGKPIQEGIKTVQLQFSEQEFAPLIQKFLRFTEILLRSMNKYFAYKTGKIYGDFKSSL